jgi:hypothetical protein
MAATCCSAARTSIARHSYQIYAEGPRQHRRIPPRDRGGDCAFPTVAPSVQSNLVPILGPRAAYPG